MNSFIIFALRFLALACLLFSLGCKKEMPNPEVLDPIYKDLVKEAKEYKKQYEEELKRIETLQADYKKTLPRTVDRKIKQKGLSMAKKKVRRLEQLYRYYEIRAERRRVEGRRAYRLAFRQDKSWPDSAEYDKYLIHKKLQEADLNWNKRVPKLHFGNPNKKEGKKEKSE